MNDEFIDMMGSSEQKNMKHTVINGLRMQVKPKDSIRIPLNPCLYKFDVTTDKIREQLKLRKRHKTQIRQIS